MEKNMLKFTPAEDIPVKSPTDNGDNFLSSMLHLGGSKLLLADFTNGTVRLVDIHTNSLESQTMEVPGKKLQAGSSAEDTTYCQPCEQDEEILPADSYCTVCKEFFCSHCANVHRKQKMTRSHLLLDKSNMPTSISGIEVEYECTVPCDIHPKESIKYFCSTHQTLICGHCSVQNHRSCHADVISDLSKAFKDGQEYGDVIKTIARLFKEIDLCASDVEKNVDVVASLGENEVFKLRKYREEVNKYFEERERALLKLIEKTKSMDEELLGSLKPKYTNLKSKLEELNVTLEAQENNMIQLFIETKRVKKLLEGMQNENVIHLYELRKDPGTERLIASDTGIGTLENITTEITTTSAASDHGIMGLTVQEDDQWETIAQWETITTLEPTVSQVFVDLTIYRFTLAMDIPMKSPTHNKNCYLSSMLRLSESGMLIVDCNNCTVKMVDMHTNNLVSQISVPGQPWDICHLSGYTVAVTMFNLGIQLLETRGQLVLGNRIELDGECRGIAYHENRLIVSFYDGKVAVLDMNGHVIRVIGRDDNGKKLFERPVYLSVVCEGSTAFIYVSDMSRNTITKLGMNLDIINTFQDPALKSPRCITVFGDQLLISVYGSGSIMILDLSTGHMAQLMGEKEGIRNPLSVHHLPQYRKILVTEYSNNSVKVFNTIG
ncbi:E3 ubiquitin-protein ligase TRIM71-like [Mya arenaria]|uniref:E3 ubiquitin-protein ligase TRIM71-like n=1 Tax=Mya arenaria TaxID=6604 RepID=UPI0022E4B8B6|nr:E3 ubiquitin-protein ligase TRIM71-like [Mya arenaria]